MFEWLSRNKPIFLPKETLAEAIADMVGDVVAQRALQLFDSPDALEIFLEEAGTDAPWANDERQPEPDELAATIFFELLRQEEYIGMVDWADGAGAILEVQDILFAKAGVAAVSTDERSAILAKAERCKRGEVFMKVQNELEQMADLRGLVHFWINLEQDAYFPMVLKPAVYERWRHAKFGKKFPVFP